MESSDVAKVAGISVSTLRQDLAAGRLEPVAVTRRGVRLFSQDAVVAYVEGRRERERLFPGRTR